MLYSAWLHSHAEYRPEFSPELFIHTFVLIQDYSRNASRVISKISRPVTNITNPLKNNKIKKQNSSYY
ncbi:hypothetical protein ENTCAN_07837 [Enterobacter cancerogenus ATCC 35316]|nr:hypothetical protein ENTCAN_07837 [Enterobacter cancerogenus ATCC 35316]